MKKKVVSIMLCGFMAMGLLAGCGSTAATAPASSAPAASEAATPAAETTVASVEEAASTVASEASTAAASGTLINIGFAQVGHESDWRTASTKSCQDTFSEANGYNLSFVDCDNDSAAQLEAVR